jgi:polar amino acid transport system substrate-binding protein
MNLRHYLFPFLSLIVFGLQCSAAFTKDLHFGIAETTSPPLFNSLAKSNPGILPDFFRLLAIELHGKPNMIVTPRGRIAMMLLYGELDAYCYSRPDWLEHSSELHWSSPIFSDRNILVSRAGTPVIKNYSDLKNKKVATVQGFQYPELEETLAANPLVRSDSVDVATTLEKLELNRVDYALLNELYFQYFKKTHPKAKLNEKFFVVRTFDVFCALSPRAAFTVPEFNAAIERLKSKNQIQKLIEKYK